MAEEKVDLHSPEYLETILTQMQKLKIRSVQNNIARTQARMALKLAHAESATAKAEGLIANGFNYQAQLYLDQADQDRIQADAMQDAIDALNLKLAELLAG